MNTSSAPSLHGRPSPAYDAHVAEAIATLRTAIAEFGSSTLVQASSLGAEDVVLGHLIESNGLGIPFRARYRQAAPRNAGAAASHATAPPGIGRHLPPQPGQRAGLCRGRRRRSHVPQPGPAQALLPHPQARTAGARPGKASRPGLPACAVNSPAPVPQSPARRQRAGGRPSDQVQPARQLDLGRRLALHRHPSGALQPAARRVLPQHRLRSLHARSHPGRGLTLRPLVVGAGSGARMRPPPYLRNCIRNQPGLVLRERTSMNASPPATQALPANLLPHLHTLSAATRSPLHAPATGALPPGRTGRKPSSCCAKSPPVSNAPPCYSRAARTRWCCSPAPKKAFGRGRIRSRC